MWCRSSGPVSVALDGRAPTHPEPGFERDEETGEQPTGDREVLHVGSHLSLAPALDYQSPSNYERSPPLN